ncbi:MAG TPA: RDD family protein [Thermoanaerobaculia bacterium]|nr:RDD family protein [Thermoanaerobaculia bacterium]
MDLPLRGGEADFSLPLASENSVASSEPPPVASLSARWPAFAADAAAAVLLTLAALLSAMVWRAGMPRVPGLIWAAVFIVYLSGFATILPLTLFGKTVGMALTGLSARDERGSQRLTLGQAAQRWAGTLLTAATLGAPLLWTMSSFETPTPADRLSGRPLVKDQSRVEGRELRV